ncbi:MAG: hypothetical protein GEU78_13880 [Actinobacteria bacterium]|nr:hypothetical protein [Actinomycetota bacterium]
MAANGMVNEYSISELMVCVFSRQIQDESVGVMPGVRSEVPLGSACLAARMHAPDMYVHTVHGDIDPTTLSISGTTSDYEGSLSSYQIHPLYGLFDMLHHGDVDWCFYGGMQVDQFANINLNAVGDWQKPKVRGPGSAGGPSENWAKRFMVWINEHSPRVFMPHVDFVGVPGYEKDREALQIPGIGPDPIVTPLAVLEVDRGAGRLAVRSIHSGVGLQEVVDSTGFELIIPDDVPQTDPPTEQELHLLRTEVDPKGILRKENRFG